MITVSDDPVVVDSALRAGEVVCPGCSAPMAPWGSARPRPVRHGLDAAEGIRVVVHRPRRARCSGCGVTHVLLGVQLALRRADAAEVIAAAVELKVAAGWGHRRIGAWLGRPATTVRGWLRAFASSASAIGAWFTGLVVSSAPDPVGVWPAIAGDGGGAALSWLEAYAAGLGARFGVVGTVAWVRAGIAATGGRLFSPGFWTSPVQHQPALYGAVAGPRG